MCTYKAVLFDFDGVLGKTVEDNCRAWEHSFGTLGLPFDREEYLLLEGKRGQEIVEAILTRHHLDTKLGSILIERKNTFYKANNTFTLYEGAENLIGLLKSIHVKLAIVSGGNRERIRETTPAHVFEKFDAVVTGDDITVGKPSPEPYLKAAKKLGVNPMHCLVVENAPYGIQSAKSAGMDCVALCSTLAEHHLSAADKVLRELIELPQFLGLDSKRPCETTKLRNGAFIS